TPNTTANPATCPTGEFCYNDGTSDNCYAAAKCATLNATAGFTKSATPAVTTTDPATCTAPEACYNDGTSDACYTAATTTMATTAGSTVATGSTAATGSTTASGNYSGTCVDSNTNCATWVKNGFCTSTVYTTEQKGSYCAKSCNLQPACAGGGGGAVTGCVDSSANCPTWARNGFCTSSFYASQLSTCKKTCNIC
ncbi:unnamed protein product, partial [Mesorhabditis spiculigera]